MTLTIRVDALAARLMGPWALASRRTPPEVQGLLPTDEYLPASSGGVYRRRAAAVCSLPAKELMQAARKVEMHSEG